MNALIEILLTNAVVACVLALGVYLVTRMYKNCFAVHFLWLVVLVKLVTPPIWQVQFPVLKADSGVVIPAFVEDARDPIQGEATVFVNQIADSKKAPAPPALTRRPLEKVATMDLNEVSVSTVGQVGERASSAPYSFPGFTLSLIFWVTVAWAAGALALISVTLNRLVAFDRSLKRSAVPNESWQIRVEQLAQRIGLARVPTVRTTEAKISPLIWCVHRKPVLVLPLQLMESLDQKQADQIIVHELAHLLRRSHWIRWFELWVTAVYWWNPVLWWARNQLHQADEACCDAMVLRHFPGDSKAYGVSLLRSAEYLSPGSGQAPLAFNFSHFNSLKRRMRMVLKDELTMSISQTTQFALAIVACVALIFSARASAVSSNLDVQGNEINSTDGLNVWVVDPAGNPVEAASVTTKEGEIERSFQTDANGTCEIGYSGDVPKLGLAITVQVDGYVPMKSSWRSRDQGQLPESLEFLLQLPSTMGGVVVDSSGKPLADIEVSFNAMTAIPSDTNIYATSLYRTTKTDQAGRWECDRVPSTGSLGWVWLEFSSAEHVYVSKRLTGQPEYELLRDRTFKQALKPGYRVRGRVTDTEGFPVFGAHGTAIRGDSTWPQFVTTDMNGEYELTGIEAGERFVTFLAEGNAPSMQSVAIVNDNAKLDFELGEGNRIQIEVKDPAGNPIANARVLVGVWRKRSSLEQLMVRHSPLVTGLDGVVTWDSAPEETLICRVFATGFPRLDDCRLSPRDAPYQIVLHPPLKVTGKVVDKASNAPIKSFSFVPGTKDPNGRYKWGFSPELGMDGELSWTQESSDAEVYFRIQAEGHRDVVTHGIQQSEGSVELEIEMEPNKTRAVSVVGPEGKPATEIQVFLCGLNGGTGIRVTNGATLGNEKNQQRLSVRDGKFGLPADLEKFNLMVFAKEGYRSLEAKDLENTNRVELLVWSQIEGTAKIGAKPAVDEIIKLSYQQKRGAYVIEYEAKVDAKGKFVFTRVPPDLGAPYVYRQIITYREGGSVHATSANVQPIILRPGETTTVDLGGQGRAVIGKLIAPGGYDRPIAQWNHGGIKLGRINTGGEDDLRTTFYGTVIRADGSFRFDDIPAGEYRFESTVRERSDHRWKEGFEIGSLIKDFVVEPMPGGRSDTPLDLGELNLR